VPGPARHYSAAVPRGTTWHDFAPGRVVLVPSSRHDGTTRHDTTVPPYLIVVCPLVLCPLVPVSCLHDGHLYCEVASPSCGILSWPQWDQRKTKRLQTSPPAAVTTCQRSRSAAGTSRAVPGAQWREHGRRRGGGRLPLDHRDGILRDASHATTVSECLPHM
jgi:hypothetical protein